MDVGSPATAPQRLTVAAQAARRLRGDWKSLRRLARKARARLGAARGTRNKLRELARILQKAKDRFAARAKSAMATPLAQSQATREAALVAQRATVSALHADDAPLPACVPAGGGTILISIAQDADFPAIYLRDRHANLHQARIIDAHRFRSQAGDSTGMHIVVDAPPELLDDGSAAVDVLLATDKEEVVFEAVALGNQRSLVLSRLGVAHGRLSFSGKRVAGNGGAISLGLFVDGDVSASCTLLPRGDRFSGTLRLDHSHLDGQPHLLELRELPGMAIVGHLYEILPLHITPWNVLQASLRPPLDATLAPQARHFLHSYQLWFERARAGGMRTIPPLDVLQAELLQGFKKRHSYPPIEFPSHADPKVSIVIPVHNRFEVTYLCLCSLLFAFNETSFEIIIVDDGSSDETRNLSEFVSGVDVLRHRKAGGFVRACNRGAARARGEFVLLLRNDTQVTARWLDELRAALERFDRVGLAGSRLVYPDGRLKQAGATLRRSGEPRTFGRNGNPDDPRFNYLQKTDFVSSAALMLRRRLWLKVGGLSEELGASGFADVDLAVKVRQTGHFVVCVPSSTVYDHEAPSTGSYSGKATKSVEQVNRQRLYRKWAHIYRDHGEEAEPPDRGNDGEVAFRALFIDHQFPLTDMDAGSYAAFQEMRLLQSLGGKVTFLPRNLAWMDRHTVALQRIGVECLYAPYVTNFREYVQRRACEYDLIYVTRHKIAEQILAIVRSSSPRTRIAFNLADLHFLRELREAGANSPGYSAAAAAATRRAELAVVTASDITFSYSDAELAILQTRARKGTRLARMPWVVDCRKRRVPYSATRDILFLGGFAHHPNVQAVKFFAREIMPLLRERLPDAVLNVVGSGARSVVPELRSEQVRILGYVRNLSESLERARVFVAPLLAGAGLKGKVLDAISHGVPCVLSSIAAEGTGLTHGVDCLIADTREAWVGSVAKLYTNEKLWNEIGANALRLAETRYSFASGQSAVEGALATIGIAARRDWGLVYRHARPDRFGL